MVHMARALKGRGGIAAAVAVVVLAVGGAGLVAASVGPAPDAPAATAARLPVAALQVEPQAGHTVTDRFLGRLEPARRSTLAFEQPGLVTEILVEEGAAVAAGAVVARLDDAALLARRDQLAAQRDQVAADLDLARRTLDRQRTLRDQGHTPAQRYDEARLAAQALTARLAETDAALRAVRIDLDKAVLRAPFAGTVGPRLLDEGTVVGAGAAVVDLLETGRPRARVGVSPEVAAQLLPGAPVRLLVGGRPVPAEVLAVRPDLSGATRTVPVLVTVDAALDGGFGDTVELHVDRTIPAPGAWVPLTALVEARRGLWSVFVLRPDGATAEAGLSVVRESVEVLHVEGDRAYVAGPLSSGDRLVAAGAHRVVPGQSVVVAQAE
ncbi:efflux RND transporter periplasmic adaptor subunit [Caenispirillum bisanense]|uniref:RND family efflux transporter, MFP subunit n=1 Tax=Caenispirillum bisanense TaxID=414052 RepID=A0A286GDH3_9PROT|nr:efflux RND transporter periplasmic adaptor subunit [Caenispirillum bisanense]SOD93550.1 RND family efflux transporter, MFP subunit [Caenispirillum bisanense]